MGISGGVDSSVTALLLKEQGYDVVGVHMTNWDASDEVGDTQCTNTDDLKMARKVCSQLNIPLIEDNYTSEYWTEVFEPALDTYARGGTPNPDVACNMKIKFGHFLESCLERGADYVATGHYAQIVMRGRKPGDLQLLSGADEKKDQVRGACMLSGKLELTRNTKRDLNSVFVCNGRFTFCAVCKLLPSSASCFH